MLGMPLSMLEFVMIAKILPCCWLPHTATEIPEDLCHTDASLKIKCHVASTAASMKVGMFTCDLGPLSALTALSAAYGSWQVPLGTVVHKVKPAVEAHADAHVDIGEEPFTFQKHWVGARDYVSSEEEEEATPTEKDESDRAEHAQARGSNEPDTEVMLASTKLCNLIAQQQRHYLATKEQKHKEASARASE